MNNKEQSLYKDSEFLYSADVQKICEKHNLSRHSIIIIATKVARLGDFTPKEALLKLSAVDNIDDYLVNLKFAKEGKRQRRE